MQTFLPYPNFDATARCLDSQRLANQRVEAKVILKTALGCYNGWKSHPVVKMWRGHELQLVEYGVSICEEWQRRKNRDSLLDFFIHAKVPVTPLPWWLDDPRLCASHRSNLLRKNPEYYGQFGWKEPSNLPYFWPQL
jgi:hypothetical protein